MQWPSDCRATRPISLNKTFGFLCSWGCLAAQRQRSFDHIQYIFVFEFCDVLFEDVPSSKRRTHKSFVKSFTPDITGDSIHRPHSTWHISRSSPRACTRVDAIIIHACVKVANAGKLSSHWLRTKTSLLHKSPKGAPLSAFTDQITSSAPIR